jgi:hypothetical protein
MGICFNGVSHSRSPVQGRLTSMLPTSVDVETPTTERFFFTNVTVGTSAAKAWQQCSVHVAMLLRVLRGYRACLCHSRKDSRRSCVQIWDGIAPNGTELWRAMAPWDALTLSFQASREIVARYK